MCTNLSLQTAVLCKVHAWVFSAFVKIIKAALHITILFGASILTYSSAGSTLDFLLGIFLWVTYLADWKIFFCPLLSFKNCFSVSLLKVSFIESMFIFPYRLANANKEGDCKLLILDAIRSNICFWKAVTEGWIKVSHIVMEWSNEIWWMMKKVRNRFDTNWAGFTIRRLRSRCLNLWEGSGSIRIVVLVSSVG